jgi:propionyl-CoA synthetase
VLAGRGDQPALIYDSPVTDTKSTRTFSELLEEVATFAGALAGMLLNIPVYVQSMFSLCSVYVQCEGFAILTYFAGALADLGVGKGDRVVIYMPMIPEAIVAMLACARIGVRGREEEERTELETQR